ncbi:hypothetical protein TI39_contig4116g00003 [Zymoseptoria brevis]|uniref:C2 domain-containing protein n=1 Tax=Zymoseptoria brevis TaxID=1047168 RepID=A0A0F4GDB5_9PEZI|nr:hypothetical protein TI39_contig4116g00003 [Zymoseptoria brevis]
MSDEKEQRTAESHNGASQAADTPQTGGEMNEKAKSAADTNSEQHGHDDRPQQSSASSAEDEPPAKQPSGGYDSTPIPVQPRGYTVKFTIHRAENLPIADLNGFSSDPYCLAQINCDTPTRHKQDPCLRWRTPTVRKDTEPTWNESWIVANLPATGFKIKIRIYDEDAADQDDLLGKAHIMIPSLDETWEGIKEQGFKLRVHDGSKRAYTFHALTTCMRANKHFRGYLYVSMEMLGRTEEDGQHGRVYTVGPCMATRHFSPMLGRLVNVKEPDAEEQPYQPEEPVSSSGQKQKKVERFNFQANQFQLQGPIPPELYHRFVEFKPWVGRMFTSKGISGFLMGKALRHQHTRVYNYSRSTIWHRFPAGPSKDMTMAFLDAVHWDHGGRIFTYVLTLDALWRFTETGKEFGIDMLSKHTMHSDVSVYIAYSGEFFIRRLKHPRRPPPPDPVESSAQSHPPSHDDNPEHPPARLRNDSHSSTKSLKDPRYYELVIDNDSGTYRPNASLLPILKSYLAHQLPGLHILTLDCNADAEKQQKMKSEQRAKKAKSGQTMVFKQGSGSRSSSFSSSDDEEFNALQAALMDEDAIAREHGPMSTTAKDARRRNRERLAKAKRNYLPRLEGEAARAGSVEEVRREGGGGR